MKTILIIWSLAGGSPVLIDYHTPSECERAARTIQQHNSHVLMSQRIDAICVEAANVQ